MDLGGHADRVRFMIRPRIELHRRVRGGPRRPRHPERVGNVGTPRMNAITERWTGDAVASCVSGLISEYRLVA
jgi:hypothetical protein